MVRKGYLTHATSPELDPHFRSSLVWFYGISNPFGSFNAESFLYLYIRYIWFALVGFYGISTLVGYLIPNNFYTYIINIYDLIWFGGISTLVGHLIPNYFYAYISKNIFGNNIFKRAWAHFFIQINGFTYFYTQFHGSNYSYESLTIQLFISHLFTLLNELTVLFQTIQFAMSSNFNDSKYCNV